MKKKKLNGPEVFNSLLTRFEKEQRIFHREIYKGNWVFSEAFIVSETVHLAFIAYKVNNLGYQDVVYFNACHIYEGFVVINTGFNKTMLLLIVAASSD